MTTRFLSVPALALTLALSAAAEVKIQQGSEKISVEIDGAPFTDFYVSGTDVTKPFLHPLRTGDGKIVSRVWPMQEKEGEAKDHVHHQGLWFSHGDVNGFDFWANHPSQKSDKKGTIVLEQVRAAEGGERMGRIAATFAWKDPSGKVLLRENRLMVFRAMGASRVIDFDIRLTGVETAKFGDTKEGTFAIRLTAPLDGKHTGKMTNAEGKTGEKQVWGKASPWVDYAGQLEGETVGIAILDHPSNPKHPTYWHSRDYGLFAANIFGEHDFFNDKSRDGSLTLEPGQQWRFRYRVVIHPGDAEAAHIGRMYERWSTAPAGGKGGGKKGGKKR
ncbi:MAG: PmoA family protein [Bryobacteraceae bacterium]